MESTAQLLPINVMARRLRVPLAWLKGEADAGRIPHLKAGTKYLFNSEVVERLMLSLAAGHAEAVTTGQEVAHALN